MATEKKQSKGRFLYLFDWNAKSKKKLFSNKSELAEGSNQGNDNVDNLVISQYLLNGLCENVDSSSFHGNGNYNSSSFINEDDGYRTKPPGVVARLMGLDTMPTTYETSSISSYESHPINGGYHHKQSTSFQHENDIRGYDFAPNNVNTKRNKIYGRPIERFQTEVLPPKSAKPISITHHRLLSPIKSPGFIPTRDAAYIMEAASRIIDSSPHPTNRIKIPSLGSPSTSFRVPDLKERMDSVQRSSRLSESSKTPKRSTSLQQMEGNSYDRASSRSLFKNTSGVEEANSSHKAKSKSKPLRVRDNTNMKRKEQVYNDDRSRQQKEPSQVKLKQKQPSSQKTKPTRTSGVLRQNNDKQNRATRKDKSVANSSASEHRRGKSCARDTYAGPSKIVNKVVLVNVENGSKKVVAASNGVVKRAYLNGVDEKRPSLNKMKNISRNKQYPCRDHRLSKDLPNSTQSCQSESSRMDMDVVSFTFTSPIKKSGTRSSSSNEASRSNCVSDIGACDMSSPRAKSSLLSPSGLNIVDSGSLSLLLEQKLRELTDQLVPNNSGILKENADGDSMSCYSESISSHDIVGSHYDEWSDKDEASTTSSIAKSSQKWEDFDGIEERGTYGINKCETGENSDTRHLNISITECCISESCMSSKTSSNVTCGYDQHEVTSCISTESVHRREEDETDFTDVGYWEVEYIRHVLHYAGLKIYRLDMDCKLIDLGIFDLLENLIITSGKNEELCSQTERKILFDGVVEIVRSRYERVYLGSHKEWVKWEMMLQNDWLIEDVYKEILSLQSMGNLMVDEVVDRDMSSQYGRWLDFKIESLEEGMEIEDAIVASLVDELVVDLFV